jgi:outer membrane protein TolC
LAAREREVERAVALRRLAGRIYEAPELGLGWKRIDDHSFRASGPVFSASWTVPLFERRQADRKEAEARLAAARADLELLRSRTGAQSAGALAAYHRLVAEAGAAERAAGSTPDLVTGAAAAFQLGETGLTDFLDTLRAALAARLTALEVREAAWAAQRDLEAANGRPLLGEMP